ncbi:MarR family transcriptional regulator [Azospirillum brasilense]|uniref:MarR family transcriptional regulator n=2 Tax=Azospirillum TaxID=191 RepID=A0A2K1G6T8_9PROT|nr:MarR family transcriptional regulator [Azospirillum argentinense]KAA1054938.1 Transcriptional regulator, MarR family [Azospirillum argentinense]MBK3797832.1 MarR family transcriptional regulator [Azospirillum argentinense]PNR00497.1 MarR family transcriptional regulator [Azospirillum argentinense]QCO04494.1 MarR family transcriptional regulator [Azospirillum argentinense]
MKGPATAAAETSAEAQGDVSVDVEAAADLAASPEMRLWLRLSACAVLIGARLRSRLRDEFSTTQPRFDLLCLLDRQPEGLTMGELSKRMMVTNGNVTGIVERLSADGLVTRAAASNDRRMQFVRITPEGSALAQAIAAAQRRWLAELMEGMPHGDVVQLMGLLGKLKNTVRGGGVRG